MRPFYLEYSASELLQPLVGEISWAKHLLITARCQDPPERYFYTVLAQYSRTKSHAVAFQW